jgi:hypothetical protein
LCGKYPDSICIMYNYEVLTIRELIDKVTMEIFPSDMGAIFSQYYVTGFVPALTCTVSVLPREKKRKEFKYFSVTGPNYTFIRVEDAEKEFEPHILINYDGKDVSFQYKEGCCGELDPAIASQLFAMYFSYQWKKPRFKDEEYYDLPSYGLWTVDAHINQMERVLEGVPKQIMVVAPGDGIGVVSRVRDKVIAGDMAVNCMTHFNVKKESITSTIARGKAYENKKIFILSYVSAFMTDSDWDALKDEMVVVVDAYHVIRAEIQLVGDSRARSGGLWSNRPY